MQMDVTLGQVLARNVVAEDAETYFRRIGRTNSVVYNIRWPHNGTVRVMLGFRTVYSDKYTCIYTVLHDITYSTTFESRGDRYEPSARIYAITLLHQSLFITPPRRPCKSGGPVVVDYCLPSRSDHPRASAGDCLRVGLHK